MSNTIHGHAVVRPHPHYRGVDRLPWEGTEVAFYAGTLPTDLATHYGDLQEPGPWLPRFVRDIDVARMFLQWERLQCPNAEIVSFSAPYLAAEGVPDQSIDAAAFIGFDVLGGVGEWSLIRSLFDELEEEHPALEQMASMLNAHGLLKSADQAASLVEMYDRLACQDYVEQRLNADGYLGWQAVDVYLPRISR